MNIAPRFTKPAILLAIALSALMGCNTVRGVGKDTEVVGEKIQKEADQHIDDKEKPAKDDGAEANPNGADHRFH